jgi:hypothetical protein
MKSGSKKSPSNPPGSKMKERRLARQREQRRSQLIRIGGIVAAVIGFFLLIYFVTSSNSPDINIEGLQRFSVRQGHTTEPVIYEEVPPVGGIHNPAWQNCGVYSQPVANENAVHSLEHGAVWITYQLDLPADEVEKLETLTRQSAYRLLSPYPDLPSPIVISAWGYQLQLEQADDPRLLQFITSFEQSPRAPEPGASCSGGVGQPE